MAFDGQECYIVLPVMLGMPDLQPSVCSKGPDGRAPRADRTFQTDGLRPCRFPPEGQRWIPVRAHSCVYGYSLAIGYFTQDDHYESCCLRNGQHFQSDGHSAPDPVGPGHPIP